MNLAKFFRGGGLRESGAIEADISPVELPPTDVLLAALHALAEKRDPVSRYLDAFNTGTFKHPDGRSDELGVVKVEPEAVALLSYLIKKSPTPLSIEVGFGMGTSCAVLLSTLADTRRDFEHVVFDPFGLGGGRGTVVEAYLKERFGRKFRRVRQRSEIGLAQLYAQRGAGAAGFVFIDGSHLFENVVADFVLADLLCARGGFIAFDDSCYPAIEAVVNYIAANRPDYTVMRLAARNLSVIQKIHGDKREWFSFNPFEVPNRRDWTPADAAQIVPSRLD
ncbi:class I SAM-dependent methyltransferase [Hyphomicrobium facile]|uniref:Methyltransferase domain-containing protein n=1 Tax=Hyphomicrobium facile TaxID=51670 RepID=A0A1I7NU09_9HYPH|nr:class I SAM-dependent methyltransferase [Hyphomicrobium facile]SFV38103.1 Methyltransferase domain-containing protein [Hyphomicrobium facile]